MKMGSCNLPHFFVGNWPAMVADGVSFRSMLVASYATQYRMIRKDVRSSMAERRFSMPCPVGAGDSNSSLEGAQKYVPTKCLPLCPMTELAGLGRDLELAAN